MASKARDEADTSCEGLPPRSQSPAGAVTATVEAERRPSQASSDPDANATRRAFINLGLLASLGALGSAWILFYTDWFPLVSGVLGLGGLFAWAAFLGGLLTEDRKKSLQAAFERSVLTSRLTSAAVPAFFGLFLLYASLHGSVVLDSQDERGRMVAVVPQRSTLQEQADRDYLAPHSEEKRVVFTGWLGRSYVVKASGLPSASVAVWPLHTKQVSVPTSFAERVVLLVHLSPNLSRDAETDAASFVVKRDGKDLKTIGPSDFRGGSVWVGCDADVEIPEKVVDSWRTQLARLYEVLPDPDPKTDEAKRREALRSQHEWLNRWLDPVATGDLGLGPLNKIQISVVFPDGHAYSDSGSERIGFEERGSKIRLVYLDYPRQGGAGS